MKFILTKDTRKQTDSKELKKAILSGIPSKQYWKSKKKEKKEIQPKSLGKIT